MQRLGVLGISVLLLAPRASAADPGYDNWPRLHGDVDHNGVMDLCRFVGDPVTPFFACRLMNADGSVKDEYGYQYRGDPGFATLPHLMGDVNGDGRADFCRFVGVAAKPTLSCVLAGEKTWDGDEHAVSSAGPIDPGSSSEPRELRDQNGDGKLDYCRTVTLASGRVIACSYGNGTGFEVEPKYLKNAPDNGWPELGSWRVDVDGDKQVDFCRYVGERASPFLACRLLDAAGATKSEYAYQHKGDQGFAELPRMMGDVNGDGRADFCRFVSSPTAPLLQCRLAGANDWEPNQFGFGSNVPMDVGFSGWTRELRDRNQDGKQDFCRYIGVRDYPEWVCNYSDGTKFATDYSDRLHATAVAPSPDGPLKTGDRLLIRSPRQMRYLFVGKLVKRRVQADWAHPNVTFSETPWTLRHDGSIDRLAADRSTASMIGDDLLTVEVLPPLPGDNPATAGKQKVHLKGTIGKYLRIDGMQLVFTASIEDASVLLVGPSANGWEISVVDAKPDSPRTKPVRATAPILPCTVVSFELDTGRAIVPVAPKPGAKTPFGTLLGFDNETMPTVGGPSLMCGTGMMDGAATLELLRADNL